MRIATWNMDYWKRSAEQRTRAWEYLSAHVRPDIALVQEAVPGKDCKEVVFRSGGLHDDRKSPAKDLGCGSAVVSFGPQIHPVEYVESPFRKEPNLLLRTFLGSVAIAKVGGKNPLVVVSAYGVIDRGYADTTVHRILSDLTPLVDEMRGKQMIIAGDLNITTQWSVKHKGFLKGLHDECFRRDSNLFERFAALGFRNIVVRSEANPLYGCECNAGPACRHVQTQRHEHSTFPWQNDYIFVTEDLLDLNPKVEVFDQEEAWALSGHCPIVVEFPNH